MDAQHPAMIQFSPTRSTWLVLGLFGVWLVLLGSRPEIAGSAMAVLGVLALLLLGWARWLAVSAATRRSVTAIFVVSLLVYTAQVLVIRTYPQLVDSHSYSDSFRYQRHALALAMHWRGEAVPTHEFLLAGLASRGIGLWPADSGLGYGEVLGGAAYPYALFLGVIYWLTDESYFAGVFANLPMMAAIPVAVFLLASSLTGSRRVAWVATALIVLDPNLAVWGAVPLRDTHIALFATLSLLSVTRGMGAERSTRNVLQGLAALVLLGLYRFNAAVAFCLAGLPLVRLQPRVWLSIGMVVAVCSATLVAVPGLNTAVQQTGLGRLVATHLQIVAGADLIADSARPERSATAPVKRSDSPRMVWKREFQEQPLWLTAVKATARTLMAPYPWVAWLPGVTGRNYYELMFPGMALWVICLPGLVVSVARGIRRPSRIEILFYAWLALATAIYVIGFGEFSGRARLMAMPLLWILSARGLVMLNDGLVARWSPKLRRAEVKGEMPPEEP